MDLVYRFSRLALSRWLGMDSRVPHPRRDAFHRSLHPQKLARLLHQFSVSLCHLSDQGRKSVGRFSRHCFNEHRRRGTSRSHKYSTC